MVPVGVLDIVVAKLSVPLDPRIKTTLTQKSQFEKRRVGHVHGPIN